MICLQNSEDQPRIAMAVIVVSGYDRFVALDSLLQMRDEHLHRTKSLVLKKTFATSVLFCEHESSSSILQ